jgi:hypothetical protein
VVVLLLLLLLLQACSSPAAVRLFQPLLVYQTDAWSCVFCCCLHLYGVLQLLLAVAKHEHHVTVGHPAAEA